LEEIRIPNPLERYFDRLIDSSYDQLTYLNHHSRRPADARLASCDVDRDVCEPVHFANPRRNPVICILNSVHARTNENLPNDCFFDGFLLVAGKDSDITIMKRIKLSMRLLNNFGWSRIQAKKPKSISKTLLISISHQVMSVSY
jgi:hypothetical protein